MKWAYSVKQKTKAAFLLALVMVLVIAKNMMDSRNVSQLGSSFATVYEDRLLVESYIFQLSGHLYQKKMMLDNCSQGQDQGLRDKINIHNVAITTLLQDYEKTKLTPAEAQFFQDFKQNMQEIKRLELSFLSGAPAGMAKQQMDAQYSLAAGNLNQLSSIQVSEGKLLSDQSKQIIAGSTLLTQFEVALLICIGIMIQAIVFASKSILPKKSRMPSLN
ncbi:MAG: MCP four helix bundle domain-containing protein [Rufibacter sp.]